MADPITFDTSQWLAFFAKAGLPPNVAANYALIFSDNRIQLDMLMDLSKEYLYDMGIKVMGDVIAILRFAKEFHTQMAKERAIGNNTSVTANKVVGRMVGHYTRPLRAPPKSSLNTSTEQEPPKVQFGPKKPTIISLKRTACNDSPIKKVRRVPPEEEGSYNIKMPLGITDKTRKILQQQQLQGSKRSVFTRLGDSAVSSSTDSKSSSIFQRLGPSSKNNSDDTPTSTSLGEMKKVQRLGPPLQYQGVLKITTGGKRIISSGNSSSTRTVIKPISHKLKTTNKNIVSLNRINNILQSSSSLKKTINGSQGILSRTVFPSKVGIQSRLGVKLDSRNLTRTKILMNTSNNSAAKSNVFDRLGK